MDKPFSAYQGEEPYVFVIYAHEDAPVVYPELQWLRDQGINIWYDEGIPAGANWRARIGTALDGAARVLFYVSRGSINSEHCNREINYALDENRNIIPVLLDDTPLSPDLKIGLTRIQMIHKDELSPAVHRTTLANALGASVERQSTVEAQTKERRFRWQIPAVAGVLVAAIAGVYLGTQPRTDDAAPDVTEAQMQTDAQTEEKQSIAVLPFVNMSADPDQEYFSDGMSEEVMNLLAKNPELRVISRTSAFAFKGEDVDIPTVAERLNVTHILDGSVRKSGDDLRITVQLIDTRTDSPLWSESYDRKLDNVFAVQEDIAVHVVDELNVALFGTLPTRTRDAEVYTLYLQAHHILLQQDESTIGAAETLLKEVLERDPTYVRAWTDLSLLYSFRVSFDIENQKELWQLAWQADEQALAIDPQDALAHGQHGWQSMTADNDLTAAAHWYERALALEPTNLRNMNGAAMLAISLGRFADAVAVGEYVTARDPLCAICFGNLGLAQLFAGNLDAAESAFRTQLALAPDVPNLVPVLGYILTLKGDPAAGMLATEKAEPSIFRMFSETLSLHDLGREQEFQDRFAALVEQYGNEWPRFVARILAWTGDTEAAFEWLEKPVERDAGPLVFRIWDYLDPAFEPLHSDPRWLQYLDRLDASPAQLAAVNFEISLPE